MNRLSVAIGLALCVALPASAQYKWVDSGGKVHYSDKPPPSNVKTEKLRAPPPGPVRPVENEAKKDANKETAKTGPKTAAEQEQAFRKRQADAAKGEKEQSQKEAAARQREENCKRAKAAVANLELGGRQARINEKGERVFLDEGQITQETAKARQEAASACN
ncbi:MAG: DUF4124 domain-containing protein [Burkholderiales bacterium]|nr:DUF4124 domain-containing protein [Burkholderiales bacterium]